MYALIDKEALVDQIKQIPAYVYDGFQYVQFIEDCIRNAPTVEAVPLREHESLLRRFRHLMKSRYIASFDEINPKTGEYKRDIAEAEPVRHGRWKNLCECSECGRAYGPRNAVHIRHYHYCPYCGAKMDGDMND